VTRNAVEISHHEVIHDLTLPTENENGRGPGIDCHPERSEGSALCF
jgi:hypothetical protein